MRAFHFLKTQYALDALRHQRLKVATLNDVNDPFELFAADFSEKRVRAAFRMWKKHISATLGLLCFSRGWNESLLWSHYADHHKGIALEFEVDEAVVVPIQYRRTRMKLDIERIRSSGGFTESLAETLYATKSSSWAYEDEVRVPVHLRDCVAHGDLHFEQFGNGVELVGVVLGPLCSATTEELQQSLRPGASVSVVQSRLAFSSFGIVRNRSISREQLHG